MTKKVLLIAEDSTFEYTTFDAAVERMRAWWNHMDNEEVMVLTPQIIYGIEVIEWTTIDD